MLEVVADELEGITQGGDSSQPDVDARLLLPRSLDDGGEGGVGVGNQGIPPLLILALTDETNSCQRGLLLVLVSFVDARHQGMHQLGPLVARQLDPRDGGNDLGGGLAGLAVGRGQGLEGKLLDACLGLLGGLVEPFCLKGSLVAVLSSGEGILQGDTSGSSDVALSTFVRELLDEGREVLGLGRGREAVSLRTVISCVFILYIFFFLFFFS